MAWERIKEATKETRAHVNHGAITVVEKVQEATGLKLRETLALGKETKQRVEAKAVEVEEAVERAAEEVKMTIDQKIEEVKEGVAKKIDQEEKTPEKTGEEVEKVEETVEEKRLI